MKSIRKNNLKSIKILIFGLVLGIISKLFDIHCPYLGQMFSEIAIWILFGVLISIYSPSKKMAMLNVIIFFTGMLITYYSTAELTNCYYNLDQIIFWSIITFISPLFASITWMTKGYGKLSTIISIGVIIISILLIILFKQFKIYNLLIIIVMIYYLFIKRNIRV